MKAKHVYMNNCSYIDYFEGVLMIKEKTAETVELDGESCRQKVIHGETLVKLKETTLSYES